jgi:energy-coupling factor transporter ATP-binding protein EcfA2
MPKRERPLDAGDSALLRFASDLRRLRQKAGGPTYRVLAERVHYSVAALSDAAGGRRLPTLAVTLAYVRACEGDTAEWELRWHAVAAELAATDADATDRESGDERSPYVGLAAFQIEDAHRFFGRERLIEDLVARLARQPFVAVFGASGSGKSSLLRAGLLPRWQAGTGQRPVALFTPGPHPLEECAIALSRITGEMPSTCQAELSTDRRGLHRIVRQALAGQPGEVELMLVVDQFEEVFTLCHDQDERQRFIHALLAAVQAENSRCRVVLGIRADFYAHCTAFPELVEALRDSQVIVGSMTPAELRLAITQPAVRCGYAVETALLTELVSQAGGQVGVLPLLSHALLETWRRRRGTTLTLAGFQAAGGMDGALTQTAESVFGELSALRQQVAKNLMLRLTAVGEGTEDTKRRVTQAELDDSPDTQIVLDRLAQARLIAVDRDTVEISHEALIRAWPRLRDWLAEDRDGLRLYREITEATDAWESLNRDDGALYRGVRLARAQEWAARHGTALAGREHAFLDASLAAEEAEQRLARRHSRRLRQTVALLGVLLLLAVAAMTYAINAERSAARQRNAALSQIVAGKANALRGTNPALAAQLSLAAYRLTPTPEARTSLLAAFPFPYARRLSGHTAHVNSVAFSPDGHTVVTTSHDHTARLWDVTDPVHPQSVAVLATHTATVNAAAFRPDGRVLATASWDLTAKLWEVTDRRHPVELATLVGHSGEVNAVAFSADGRTVATVSTDRTVRLWDVTDPRAPRQLTTLVGHTEAVVTAAFSPDGTMLATGSFDHTVMLWDLARHKPPRLLAGHNARVTWVAFSPDGARLASASQDHTVKVWDPADGRELGLLAGHDGIVRSVAFSPDGRTIATAGEDRTARLWGVAGPGGYRQVAVLEAHREPVVSVAFSPDGRTLATGSDDDTAVLWKIPDTRPDRIDVTQAQAWVCEAVDTPISAADWGTYFPGVDYRPPCRKGE